MKGNLVCPNEKCLNRYSIVEKFLDHLRRCPMGIIASKAILSPIPCLICKETFGINVLPEHFRLKHTVVSVFTICKYVFTV